MVDNIIALRQKYHAAVCAQMIPLKAEKPSMADTQSRVSMAISKNLVARIPHAIDNSLIKGQRPSKTFEHLTWRFLQSSFRLLLHLRPGKWTFALGDKISGFPEYSHLTALAGNPSLKRALGDYVITPDIILSRRSITNDEMNRYRILGRDKSVPKFTPLRFASKVGSTLHATISCKWTLRSDRSQNARTEGLNLVRNRKGQTPHIAVVTGEPMPSRIASLALGTGDIDCVYHFALHELIAAVEETRDATAIDMLSTMVEGRRLRDIADLPFDLAI